MGIVRGLLSKIGLGDGAGPRERVRVFLLDDDTFRHEWFARQFKGDTVDVAADAARAVEMLSSNYYDVIFLDHDLLPEHYYAEEFDDERTGYAVARWLADNPTAQRDALVIVHSLNYEGARRMVNAMRDAGRDAEHVPFHYLQTGLRM